MNEQQYRTVIGWFNARPAAKKALRAVSTGAAAAVYLLYLGLLAWLAWRGEISPSLWLGVVQLGPWQLHPLVLLYALSGSLMISKTLRIPKP